MGLVGPDFLVRKRSHVLLVGSESRRGPTISTLPCYLYSATYITPTVSMFPRGRYHAEGAHPVLAHPNLSDPVSTVFEAHRGLPCVEPF